MIEVIQGKPFKVLTLGFIFVARTRNVSNKESFSFEGNKPRILLLAAINSAHTRKWALSLAENGFEVGLFSLHKVKTNWMADKENIKVLYSPEDDEISSSISKIFFPFSLPQLKNAIRKFKPDIVHAHYASSYGFMAALSGFHPFILSVWGSDVYDFPKISLQHRLLFKFNLRRADKICSTSNTMKEEIKKYTNKDVYVTPFGVDINVFKPFYVPHVFNDKSIVIGTVKTLEKKYGIEYLIDAFALLRRRAREFPLKLLIVGQGSLDSILKTKVRDLGIEAETIFTGLIPPAEIPSYQNMLSISVFPSENESFGVAVVEAMACEKPVIVTDVGALPEVVENGVTGLVVPPANPQKISEAIEMLVRDEQLRIKLGKQGRQRVEKLYNWENNLATMIDIYKEALAEKSKKK